MEVTVSHPLEAAGTLASVFTKERFLSGEDDDEDEAFRLE